MLMGQRASTWPDLTRSNSRVWRPRLLFSTSMITFVSSRKVAMSAAGFPFKPLVVFPAQFLNPHGRPLLELGMIFVLPGTSDGLQGLDLAQAHQFLLCRLGEKSAASPF